MAQQHRLARVANLDPFDVGTTLLIATLLVLAFSTFGHYAISNDEEVQHRYGELIIAYYTSGFADRTLFQFKNLYLYGGLFDIVAVLIAKLFPFDTFAIRHVLSALCGIAGIAATALTARLIAGPRAGTLAALTLAVSGVWYGGMFNHTKDIPFAAAMIGAIYFLLRAGRDLPTARWRDTLGFGLMLGLALGLRAIGLLLIGYLFIAIVTQALIVQRQWPNRINFVLHALIRFLPALALAYFIMIAAWPWASLAPLNPVRAIFAFAHFHYEIRTVLAGEIYEMATVPRWYVPAYLAIKLPLLMVSGAAAMALFAAVRVVAGGTNTALRDRETALIVFAALFPVLCQILTKGPAFTGLRHFLFVVPLFAVLAALGMDAALTWLTARQRQLAAAAGIAVIGAGLMWPAITLARLHPYQYLFYNSLVGGLEGASRRYVMDYWVNIMPEAISDLRDYLGGGKHAIAWNGPPYTVGVCGEQIAFEKFPHGNLQWTDDWRDADFFIAPTHMDCDRALDGRIVAKIERLGVTLGVIKDRRAITQPGLARKP